jgi:hypothetical protein
MTLVKCEFHSRAHVTTDDAVVAAVCVIAVVDEVVEVVDSEVLEQFYAQFVDERGSVEAVAGLEIVIVVAELEFQYLQRK